MSKRLRWVVLAVVAAVAIAVAVFWPRGSAPSTGTAAPAPDLTAARAAAALAACPDGTTAAPAALATVSVTCAPGMQPATSLGSLRNFQTLSSGS